LIQFPVCFLTVPLNILPHFWIVFDAVCAGKIVPALTGIPDNPTTGGADIAIKSRTNSKGWQDDPLA
jgi:hypothetical protein